MNFWTAFAAFLVATAVVYGALSINGKTQNAGGHGHDDHGGGHDDHGNGAHH